jgi:hypothetical protein
MRSQTRTVVSAVLLLFSVVSSGATASTSRTAGSERKNSPQTSATINESNWQRHPQIRTIRGIVSSINAGLKRRSFKVSERKFESCGESFFTLRRIARNAKGVVWYEDYSEGEDSSWDYHQYYDDSHRLRFVLIVVYAANGSRDQHRGYFDESGKLIWQNRKTLKGPGYFTPQNVEELAKEDPEKEYTEHQGCVEMKPTPKSRTRQRN